MRARGPPVGHAGAVLCLALSAGDDGQLGIDQRGRRAAPVLAFAGDRFEGGFVATGSADGSVRLWSPTDATCLHTLRRHKGAVTCVRVAKLGVAAAVVSAGADGHLYVWSARSGTLLQSMFGHRAAITCLTIAPDNHVVSGSDDKSVRVWSIDSVG